MTVIRTLLGILSFIVIGFVLVYLINLFSSAVAKRIKAVIHNQKAVMPNQQIRPTKTTKNFYYRGNTSYDYISDNHTSFYHERFFCLQGIENRIFTLILSLFIGIWATNAYLIFLSLIKINFSFLKTVIFFVFFLIIFIFIIFKELCVLRKEKKKNNLNFQQNLDFKDKNLNDDKKRRQLVLKKIQKVLFLIFTALIFFNFLVVLFFTFLFPIRFWDAISCWSLKGKAFFIDSNIYAFFLNHNYDFSHYSYPLYLPLAQTWLYLWIGNINETAVKVIFPVFYICLIYIIFYLFNKRYNKLYSIIFAFCLSSLPIVIDHGYIEYTNLLFSLILLLAVWFLYMFIKKWFNLEYWPEYFKSLRQKLNLVPKSHLNFKLNLGFQVNYLFLSSIFFAILSQIRTEGLFFSILFILITALLAIFNYKKIYKNLAFKESVYKSSYYKNMKIKKHSMTLLKFKKCMLFYKTYFILPILTSIFLLIIVVIPWQILKQKLSIPFISLEWQKFFIQGFLSNKFTDLFGFRMLNINSIKTIIFELFYSFNDSTRAFVGSFYGISWFVLLVLFFINIKRNFIKFNWVFFVFILFGFMSLYFSFIFIEEFKWSADRYLLHFFPLTYFYILYNLPMFKKNKMFRF